MEISGIHLISFSPCGHTLEYGRQIAFTFGQCIPQAGYEEANVTPLAAQDKKQFFNPANLVLLCAPVYGGRVPLPAVARFANLTARETPAVILVTYGNRAFDDALLELTAIAKNQGFLPVGAAACVAEHTLAADCASGRPNEADVESARNFAREIAGILASDAFRGQPGLQVPGNPDLRPYTPTPLPQQVNSNCVLCGQCWTNCPTGAIRPGFPGEVDSSACIACMGCINICRAGARIPGQEFLAAVQDRIRPLCMTPRKNEYFTI